MADVISRRLLARVMADKLFEADGTERSRWLQALAAYIVEHKLVDQAELLVSDIAHELFVRKGVLSVSVTSARPLTDQLRADLTAYLQSQTGASRITLDESVDEQLLGGLVARTPDAEIDLSIRKQLQQLAAMA